MGSSRRFLLRGRSRPVAAGLVLLLAAAAVLAAALTGDDGAPPASTGLPAPAVTTSGTVAPDGAVNGAAEPPVVRAPGEPRWAVVPSRLERLDPASGGSAGDVEVFAPTAGVEGMVRGRLPVVVLLGARGVHPTQYAQLAHEVAGFGVVVLVPQRVSGAEAVAAARRWAARSDRALRGDLSVLALDHAALAVAASHEQVDSVAAYLPRDDRPAARGASSPVDARKRPVVLVTGRTDASVVARSVVTVRRPDLTTLTVTDEGARGPARSVVVPSARVAAIADVARWFGAWFAAQRGDIPSQTLLDGALRDADDASVLPDVSSVGPSPW